MNPPRSPASCAAEVRVGFLNRDEMLLCSRLSQQRAAPAARPEHMAVRRRRARETDRAQGSLQARRAPEPVDNHSQTRSPRDGIDAMSGLEPGPGRLAGP